MECPVRRRLRVVTIAADAALQAVDGVALKQAVDAWANAPESEKAMRFASAEAIRWLEWGFRSYQSYMLGLAFLFFAVSIIATGRIQKAIGYLMGLSGLAYLAQGWVLGAEGFSVEYDPNLGWHRQHLGVDPVALDRCLANQSHGPGDSRIDLVPEQFQSHPQILNHRR